MSNKNHEHWMRIALEEAEHALVAGELPIGGVLVSNGKEIGRTQTHVARCNTLAAHGELFALMDARLFSVEHPLVMYTTLEPCLMCVGAMMQCGVDEVVFGMKSVPDGGTRYVNAIREGGQIPPNVVGAVLESECVKLFHKLLEVHPNHLAANYVRAMLAAYD